MTACRRCQTDATQLSRAQDELGRIARWLARRDNAKAREQLVRAKADVESVRQRIREGRDCDDLNVSTRKGMVYTPGLGYHPPETT